MDWTEAGALLTLGGIVVAIGLAVWQDRQRDRTRTVDAPSPSSAKAPAVITSQTPHDLHLGCFPYAPLCDCQDEVTWRGPRRRYVGLWVDLATELGRRLRRRITFSPLTVPELLTPETVRQDGVISIFKTRLREKTFDFSIPLHSVGLQGVCRADQPAFSIDEVRNSDMRVVVQEGEVGWEFARQELRRSVEKGNLKARNFSATQEAHDMILSGRFDIGITDALSCAQFVKSARDPSQLRLAFAQDDPSLPPRFETCLALRKELQIDMGAVDDALYAIRNRPQFLRREAEILSGLDGVVTRLGIR